MISVKKIVYFLFACDEKYTERFLSKYGYCLEENKSFPGNFIKCSKNFFIKNKKVICLNEESKLLTWRSFCKNSVYEQVLPVVLFGILKYSKKKISLFLKIPEEILSYRLKEGFSILEEELLKINSRTPKDHEAVSFNVNPEEKQGQGALTYCDGLAELALPDTLDQIKARDEYKKIKYWWWAFFCLIFLTVFVLIVLFILSPSKEVILYHSFLRAFDVK